MHNNNLYISCISPLQYKIGKKYLINKRMEQKEEESTMIIKIMVLSSSGPDEQGEAKIYTLKIYLSF